MLWISKKNEKLLTMLVQLSELSYFEEESA